MSCAAFPSYRSCDPSPCIDYYDDCAECGFVPFPDDPVLPLQIIQGGPSCYRCKPLPYQVQVPVPSPAPPCGQQFGVRIEVPKPALPCNPCLNVGYEIESPRKPCAPKLPNLPVSLTVPVTSAPCQRPCHINYELDTPVAPCSPLLTNLKTQVDRISLPCPCPAPIVEGYVQKFESSSERCKRCVEYQDSGCDCDDYNTDDDEDDDAEWADCQSSSRCRRSAPNWGPSSYNKRIELFPISRMETNPRSDWKVNGVDTDNIEDYDDDYSDENESDWPSTEGSTNPGSQRIVNRDMDEQRIVSPGPDSPDDTNQQGYGSIDLDEQRIVNRGLDSPGATKRQGNGSNDMDEQRIVSRGLDSAGVTNRQYNRSKDTDEQRIVSRGLTNSVNSSQTEDMNGGTNEHWIFGRHLQSQGSGIQQGKPELSSDPVGNRLKDPNFGVLKVSYQTKKNTNRDLKNSFLSSGENPHESSTSGGDRVQRYPADSRNRERTVPHIVSGTLRTRPQRGGRVQSSRIDEPQYHKVQGNGISPPGRINGSSAQNRIPVRNNGAEDRITTQNTYRNGERHVEADLQAHNSSLVKKGLTSVSLSQPRKSSQRRKGSQRQEVTKNPERSQQEQARPVRLAGTQQQLGLERPESSQKQDVAQQRQGQHRLRENRSQQSPESNQQRRHEQPQRRDLGQYTNLNQRGLGQCNNCGKIKQLQVNPHYSLATTPDEAISLIEYLDYPVDMRLSAMNTPPRRGLRYHQQSTPELSIASPLPETRSSASSLDQNTASTVVQPPQPPQAPFPEDTGRIVTPNTFDEGRLLTDPEYFDYDYYTY